MAKVPADALTTLGHFRGILDAIATGGILASGGYEELRRTLLSDAAIAPYLPGWLQATRTDEEFRRLLRSHRDDVLGFVHRELEPAFSHFEAEEFSVPEATSRPASIGAMRCPYCAIAMRPIPSGGMRGQGTQMFYNDGEGGHHTVASVACPECRGIFLTHSDTTILDGLEPGTATTHDSNVFVLLPRVSSRGAPPTEVTEPYASLYVEAALILADSPRASAMLSRRCVQQILSEKAHAPDSKNLYAEIEWTIEHGGLPSHITDTLHEPRIVGNMGAHPTMTGEGEYIEVVAGEAEWMLDVLDALFDHYFVGPVRAAARKAALDARLGKTP